MVNPRNRSRHHVHDRAPQPATAYGGSEFTSAFGGEADMAGFAAGSTGPRMTRVDIGLVRDGGWPASFLDRSAESGPAVYFSFTCGFSCKTAFNSEL
jgi:hypothetical protein